MYELKGPYQDLTRQVYNWFTLFTQAGTGLIGTVSLNDEAWCQFSGHLNLLAPEFF
jgi:hypothetical protein